MLAGFEVFAEGDVFGGDVVEEPVAEFVDKFEAGSLFGLNDGFLYLADLLHEARMCLQVRLIGGIAVQAHDELFGEEVHIGKLDELLEDVSDRTEITAFLDGPGERIEQLHLEIVLGINGAFADSGYGVRDGGIHVDSAFPGKVSVE